MKFLTLSLLLFGFAAQAQSVVDFMPLQPEELEIIDFAQDEEGRRFEEMPARLPWVTAAEQPDVTERKTPGVTHKIFSGTPAHLKGVSGKEESASQGNLSGKRGQSVSVNSLQKVKASSPLNVDLGATDASQTNANAHTPLEPAPNVAQPESPQNNLEPQKNSHVAAPSYSEVHRGYVSLPDLIQGEKLVAQPSTQPSATAGQAAGVFTPPTLTDVEGFGILTTQNGGFAENLWEGLTKEQAETSLRRFQQQGIKSQQGYKILRRMLLSQATPPAGESDISWLALRAQTLQRMGDAEAARSLLVGLQRQTVLQDALLARTWVENRFLSGEIVETCEFVRAHILNTDNPFWRRALLVCQGLENNPDALRLSLSIAEDQNSLLFKLLKGIEEKSKVPPRLALETKFTALESTLYSFFPEFISPDVIPRLPNIVLRRLMVNETLALSVRLQAAEKLVNDEGLESDIELLETLYEAPDFDMAHMMDPIRQVDQEVDGSMARALLWQVAGQAPLASTKAVALQKLWLRADQDSLYTLGARLLPKRRGLVPEPTLAWFAPSVVERALQAGQFPVATVWWKVLKNNRSLSSEIMVKRAELSVAYALVTQELELQELEDWWQFQEEQIGLDSAYLQKHLSVLEAGGLVVPALIWQRMHLAFEDAYTEQIAGPGPLWLRLLATHLEEQKVGAALLVALEPFMYVSPEGLSAQGVANIISGLRFLGFKEDAAVISLEALLAQPEEE